MKPSAQERFWASIDKRPDGCWQWTRTIDVHGYGQFSVERRVLKAHRYSYEYLVGPIGAGLQIDHLCRNRACVNPEHLEPVTQRENILRGEGLAAQNARKTHCIRGHELAGDNLVVWSSGKRACAACHRVTQHAAYIARKLRAEV